MTLNGVPDASLHDARQLPAAEDLADQVGASREERHPPAAVEREAVRRVEARQPLGELLVRTVLVGVARADERRFGRGVGALAERVGGLELQPAREALVPLDFEPVIPALGVVADQQVGRVERIGPPLVRPRHARADLVVGDRHGVRAGGVVGDAEEPGAGAQRVGGDRDRSILPRRSGKPAAGALLG